MTYTLTNNPSIIVRDGDGAFIPADPNNIDYQDYEAWLSAGNRPNALPPPTIAQEAAAYLAGGLTVTSDDPSINGTYNVDSPDNLNINSIITSLANGNGLPLSISQVTLFDLGGAPHQFATQEITAFSVAVRDFVHGCRLYAHGQADSLPPNTVQIESLALPVNTTAPVVTQTIGVLTCTQGDWDGVPKNYSYEWRSNWVTTVGTDSPTYVIDTANDIGQTLDCIVTAGNVYGAVQAASNGLVVVDPSTLGTTS